MNDAPAPVEEERSPTFMEELPTLLAAVAVALLIRTFLFQTFYVPSDSMFPTMLRRLPTSTISLSTRASGCLSVT